MQRALTLAAVLALGGIVSTGLAGNSARIWEEAITLPTYKVAPPDPSPRFYSGRTYQGAKATFYPYPVSDQMTEVRENQNYQAVYLENPYIKMSVLPEIGGRIFTAVDKSNGYDFFYRQHVIKPALIGMLGAWISGGVEWNIPHHHRASSFMPVDYKLEEDADGGKTVWVGETELRHRMKWMVGLTLRPDRSYIEMTVKLFNRTPEAQAFLFWINPAVHANTNYQVLFPPSTEWAVQHSKPEFASWPVARQVYGGTDYTRGVDISWWKNHPSPVSFFAWDSREDFFGGYDHGRRAGVAQIANHHVSPGKKFFEWGNGPEGEMWTKILSDEDGPYLELMAGSYSDNQPDYSWVQPCEVKVFKHYWYPIRELGGLKNANTEAALNLEVSGRTARVAFNATTAHERARAILRAGDQVLLDRQIRISPAEPFAAEVPLPEGITGEQLRASLLGRDNAELISWQPAAKANSPMPQPVKRPVAPREIASAEELYLTGLRIEQLYSPSFDPVPYYQEAIRRDPGDHRANTALGALYCRQGRYEEAEPVLRAAVERVTGNYIRSKDCEAQYYLGVALRAQGRLEAARDAFYRSIWSQAWKAAGYTALAELASLKGNYKEAVELADRALENGALNTKVIELKASLLRRLKRPAEAAELVREIGRIDPLNARALNEQSLLAKGARSGKALRNLTTALRGEVNSYLELAVDYANCGLWPEAIGVLTVFVDQAPDKARMNPLVYYYRGYFNHQFGHADAARDDLRTASGLPAEFCFPFQFEAERVLRHAMEKNPGDARAPYYLGNLLYDNQPLKAIAAWERAVELDGRFAMAQRNLGLARSQTQKDVPAATACLEKAIALDPQNPRFYHELDVLYEAGGAAVSKRLEVLNRNPEVAARRDDVVTRRIALLTASGKAEEALKILRERHFHNWEGSSALHDIYVDACLRAGRDRLTANQPDAALKDFLAALDYPANQEVGKARREQRTAQIYYHIGLAREASGIREEAAAAFKTAAEAREGAPSEGQYYKALALRKTGRNDDAEKLFAGLEKHGLAELQRESEAVDYFAKFGEKRAERIRLAQARFLAGLGCLGLGKAREAESQFKQALELHPALSGVPGR
jgi:tetratricopeptide (TPR) repeat protein